MKSLKDLPINEGDRVFVRLDLDVPINNGMIEETYRLDSSHDTLNYLVSKKAKLILAGHVGRPDGKYVEKLSTKHLRNYFDKFFDGYEYELLENLRFDSREENYSDEFAKELSSKADFYVNESFATSHREHTSMVGIPKFIPGYAGIRLEEEIKNLKKLLNNPTKPFVAVIGGAKLETKKPVIEKMLGICDAVLVGGKIGLDWENKVPTNLFLPVDYANEEKDIGEKTISMFSEILSSSKTVVWAGPLGMFEDKDYEKGTRDIANILSGLEIYTVVGGGDTISALEDMGFLDKMDFVSVGGGAMLEFLVKGTLPALEVLN